MLVATVGELMDLLAKVDRSTEITGTFEGVTREVYVYLAGPKNQYDCGGLIIDVDGESYIPQFDGQDIT